MPAAKSMNLFDALMGVLESSRTPMQMSGASVLRLPSGAGPDFVKELYEQWLAWKVTRPPLNYRLARKSMASPVGAWEVLEHVDLRQHLFRTALPYPGTDRELSDLIGRLHSAPLDRSRPLWEIHLIEGLSRRRFAYYTKVHHSLVDGVNAASMFMSPFSEDPTARDRPPPWASPHPAEPGAPETTTSGIRQVLGAARKLGARVSSARQVYAGAAELPSHLRTLAQLARRDAPAPDSLLNRPITSSRVTDAITLNLSRVRELGRMHGGTINDVVLAVCSGALRRYLLGLGQLPQESLRCLVPVAFRGADRPAIGNAASAMTVTLATDIADAGRRFAAIREATRSGKESLQSVSSDAVKMLHGARLVLPLIVDQVTGGRASVRRAFNLAISNVPGPRNRQYLYGAEMERVVPTFIIGDGMALSMLLTSYHDQFCISFTACPDTLPRIEQFARLLRTSFAELEASMSRARRPRRQAAVLH